MMSDLHGVIAIIRRNLEMVETQHDRLEIIRLITYFANKTIFHMTKDDIAWDKIMVEHNRQIGGIGNASTPEQIQLVYDNSITLFLRVKQFLEKI